MDGRLVQILNTDQQRALGNTCDAASRIWSRPLHRNYTDHTVAHSERVIALLDGLTEGVVLSPTEVLVLLAAAYLHDIGMQNERYAGGDLEEIRAIHHEISAEMIYQAIEDPAEAVKLGLPDDPGLVEAIALVAKGHRKVDLNADEYDPLTHGNETIRLRLLAALLRFADELDIDHRRVNLDLLKVMRVPDDSKLHWWKCHYVSGVSIEDGYIRVTYRFPKGRPDYEGLIVPLVEKDIREKLADLEEILWTGGVKVTLGKPQVRMMRLVQPLPAEVEALAKGQPEQSGASFAGNREMDRLRFLRVVYDRTNGNSSKIVKGLDLGGELGWNRDYAESAIRYLAEEGLVKLWTFGYGIGITHEGIKRVEDSTAEDLAHQESAFEFSVGAVDGVQVVVALDIGLQDFVPSQRADWVRQVARLVGINPSQIRILAVTPGSVVVTLEMPEESAQQLMSMYLSRKSSLRELHITKVELRRTTEMQDTPAQDSQKEAEAETRAGDTQNEQDRSGPHTGDFRQYASPITYATLEIVIGQKTDNGYPVRVRPSEAIPSARGTLDLDPASDPVRSLVEEIERGNPERRVLTNLGGLLFERLFTGEIAASFNRGWGYVRAADQGLRIQLDIEPPELAVLPWEYLRYEGHVFAISTDTPLTRFVSDLRSPLDVLEVEGQLRMLLLAASPNGDLAPLDLDGAIANITEALADVSGIELLPAIKNATSHTIREALRQHRPHIVHFVGHGYFEGERAGVILDDGSGRARRLGADQFARLFQAPPGVDEVRLLVLNACEGAKASSTQPLVGVAHNALRHVPAVVAMQYPVTDVVARSFAHEFYRSLAVRYPVDAAVSEARNALYIDYGKEWGTPVLFLRSRDGQLFAPGTGEQAVRAGAPLPALDTIVQEAVADQEQSLRVKELAYLEGLLKRYEHWLDHYTPLAGIAEVRAAVKDGPRLDLPMPFVPRGFERLMAHDFGGEMRREPVDDLCQAIREHRRIVLLGDPGSGKTTTLWRLAYDYASEAKKDESAPLPVFVLLGGYSDDGPFDAYLARHLGVLSPHLETYRASGRLVLLLDGLNEMPQADYERRVGRIRATLERYPDEMAVVTCRALDYVVELSALQRVEVSPLDHDRIRMFLHNYLGETAGERLYQALWRGKGVQELWETWQAAGGTWEQFWTAEKMPDNVYSKTSAEQDALWSDLRKGLPLLSLVRNPYMLLMTAQVYARARGVLPANQARLFEDFVDTLLAREEELCEGVWIEARVQKAGLSALAYVMQTEGERGTAVARDWALAYLCQAVPGCDAERLLHLASSASLLDASDATVRFYHQLLQEYFAARELGRRVVAAENLAGYWPEGWWIPSGWEETFILLAGMEEDVSALLVKLAEANPVVAARCLLEGAAAADEAAQDRTGEALIAAMGEEAARPQARAQAADLLARLSPLVQGVGAGGDPRLGVGLRDDGLPDIAWCKVPAGSFLMGGGDEQHKVRLSAFRIARYPVTNAQYAAFVQDDGYTERWRDCWTQAGWEWKEDRTGPETYGGVFDLPNHPVMGVTWYEAIAFCGWLTAKLRGIGNLGEDEAVTLPSEPQWEKAARGTDGRIYPWGGEADPNRANYDETGIRATSAVGCFPGGASPYGCLDMAGNVWEWTRSLYKPYPYNAADGREDPDAEGVRVVRGGSWFVALVSARCSVRNWDSPVIRSSDLGFRVVCSPISPPLASESRRSARCA
jgi:formylglycine-generating enzyme required for sulfatase activity